MHRVSEQHCSLPHWKQSTVVSEKQSSEEEEEKKRRIRREEEEEEEKNWRRNVPGSSHEAAKEQ